LNLAQLRLGCIQSIGDGLTQAEADAMVASIDRRLAAGVDPGLELGTLIDLDGPLPRPWACRGCGRTDDRACPEAAVAVQGGWFWFEWHLCSACAPRLALDAIVARLIES